MSLLDQSHFLASQLSEDATIAQNILAHVAGMRQRDQLNQSLCWDPQELELLAMFAIDAKGEHGSLRYRIAELETEKEESRLRPCGACVLTNVPDMVAVIAERDRLRSSWDRAVKAVEGVQRYTAACGDTDDPPSLREHTIWMDPAARGGFVERSAVLAILTAEKPTKE